MKYLVYVVIIYIILNGGVTIHNCTKNSNFPPTRESKKIAGAVQIISALLLLTATNLLFSQRTTAVWAMIVGILLLMVCGFVNIFLYMTTIE